jgi:hypothetical protein
VHVDFAVRRASLADDDNPAAHHDFSIVDLYEISLVHMSAKWHGHRPKLPDHSDNHSPGMTGRGSSLAPGLSSRVRGQDAPGHVVVGGASERPAVDNKPLLLRVRLIVSLLRRIFCRFLFFFLPRSHNRKLVNLYPESWRRIPRSMLPIDA